MVEDQRTDEDLLRQYQLDKNPHWLNIIFSRYLDVGFRTAMGYMRNTSDAEDVLQLAFIQFLNNLHNFREGSTTVKPWLMKMIVNTSINKLKEEKRRAKRQHGVASEKFLEYSQKENTEESANDVEILKQKIKKLVDDLPEKYRSPMNLILYEGFSYPEVATVLALPEKTVRNYVYRGIEKLKGVLGSYGSVLSVDAIASLISQSTLENAPASAKQIINSPQLNQAIKSASQSNRLLVAKSSFYSTKVISALVLCSLCTIGGYFLFFQKNAEANPSLSITNQLNSTYTNQTWSFENAKDRNLPLLMGKWEWSSKDKCMKAPYDSTLILSLPIKSQDKAFLVESVYYRVAPTKKNPSVSYLLTAFWANGKEILEHLRIELPEISEVINHGYPSQMIQAEQRIYFYQNYICIFMNGHCIRINKCTENISGGNVAIISKDNCFNKISSRTLDSPPDELLKAIKSIPSLKGEIQNKWKIDSANITIDSKGPATSNFEYK